MIMNYKYLSMMVAAMIFAACTETIDNSEYNGSLPAVNFLIDKSAINENSGDPMTVGLYVYNTPVKSQGTVKVKLSYGDNIVYGRDFTTTPEAIDNVIELNFEVGSDKQKILINPLEDSQSVETKSFSLNLCDSEGGVMVGGKYSHVLDLVNVNQFVEGLNIETNQTEPINFGEITNGTESAAVPVSIKATGLSDDLYVKTLDGFFVSDTEDGNYSNILSLSKELFAVEESLTTIWIKYMPATGFDGVVEDNIMLETVGTTGVAIPVVGKEIGNVGPYCFLAQVDGFWNSSKNVIGSKNESDWNTNETFYTTFDLSSFKKNIDKVGTILIRFTTVVGKKQTTNPRNEIIVFDLVELGAWTPQTSIKPNELSVIQSGLELPAVMGDKDNPQYEVPVEYDITEFVKNQIKSNQKMFSIGIKRVSSGDTMYIAGLKHTDESKKAVIIINDK